MKRLRDDSGQAAVLSVAFLASLVGAAALVIDVGSWYRADRAAQATADAAALAGAQELPGSPAAARAVAIAYANENGGGLTADGITFPTPDTIRVEVRRDTPGFFARLFGIESVDVGATAAARSATPVEAKWVAPIVVNEKHPDLTSFGKPTKLEYHHLKTSGPSGPDGAGSFGFINLLGGSNPGTSELGSWIKFGFDRYMKLGDYNARTGNPFSSGNIEDNLEDRIGSELLFPLYRKLTGTGSNAKYEVVGWVGFHLTGFDLNGSKEELHGHFTKVVWEGIQATSASSSNSPGVYAIKLVE